MPLFVSTTRTLCSSVAIALMLGALPWTAGAQSRAGSIATISPAAARSGESVTITGQGFGALNVQVTVGGIPAQVLSANGSRATFRVPGGVKAGVTQVVATNPGRQNGSIAFRVLEGILLPGDPTAALTNANFDLTGTGVSADQISNSVFLTRVEVRFRSDATVGQVNDLLKQINGGVVAMSRGLTSLTIAIPRQDSAAAIDALVASLDGLRGVQIAKTVQSAQPEQFLFDANLDNAAKVRHLLPSRFPAAWNALSPVSSNGNCKFAPIPVLVADFFDATPTAGFTTVVPQYTAPAPPAGGFAELDHGYIVATVLAGIGLGANPFLADQLAKGCLDLRLIQQAGNGQHQVSDSIEANMPPSGKFIVNYSIGFPSACTGTPATPGTPCLPSHDNLRAPFFRADDALYWKEKTKSRWSDFLMVVAAGNERGQDSAAIYPGMSDSRFISEPAISQLPDPLFTFAGDTSLWTPPPVFAAAGFENLVAGTAAMGTLADAVRTAGMAGADAVADNVIVVGSATTQSRDTSLTQHITDDQVAESSFSDRGPDVLAVGEEVLDQATFNGTSVAAPQVAGLASYLWMVSADLRSQPASVTKRAIVANARNKVIDAYASVLSLDAAALPNPQNAPVRLRLLDANGDTGFNEDDIEAFLRRFFVVAKDGTITRQAAPGTTADFSEWDLNGDGFTTAGARRERFDLDRLGSTRFGATAYSVVTQNIEGQDIRFDETALTDLEILCYYAYSDLYRGNPDTRKSLLSGRCGLAVQPSTATVKAGQQQQFTATTPNSDPVTWSVAGGCGTIDSKTGVFTGNTPGTCTVRATNANDSNQFGEATVTVQSGTGKVALLQRVCFTRVVSAVSFNQTLLAQNNCPTLLYSPGPPAPPPAYSTPSIPIPSTTTSDGLFNYQAKYTEGLVPDEVAANAITRGTLDVFTQTDSALLPSGQTSSEFVAASSESSLNFALLDNGLYRVSVTGQFNAEVSSFNQAFVELNFGAAAPLQRIDLTNANGVFFAPYSQPFSATQLMSRDLKDPVTGQFLPSIVAITVFAQEQTSANAAVARTALSEVTLTFVFEKVQ